MDNIAHLSFHTSVNRSAIAEVKGTCTLILTYIIKFLPGGVVPIYTCTGNMKDCLFY